MYNYVSCDKPCEGPWVFRALGIHEECCCNKVDDFAKIESALAYIGVDIIPG